MEAAGMHVGAVALGPCHSHSHRGLQSQTSGLLNCETVGFCCSKPPADLGWDLWDSLWQRQDPPAGEQEAC